MIRKEEISDKDSLFRRICKTMLEGEQILPAAFKVRPQDKGCISVDWEKYSTPYDTIKRSIVKDYNGCISVKAGNVRSIELEVEHKPSKDNRSHSVIHTGVFIESENTYRELNNQQR